MYNNGDIVIIQNLGVSDQLHNNLQEGMIGTVLYKLDKFYKIDNTEEQTYLVKMGRCYEGLLAPFVFLREDQLRIFVCEKPKEELIEVIQQSLTSIIDELERLQTLAIRTSRQFIRLSEVVNNEQKH